MDRTDRRLEVSGYVGHHVVKPPSNSSQQSNFLLIMHSRTMREERDRMCENYFNFQVLVRRFTWHVTHLGRRRQHVQLAGI